MRDDNEKLLDMLEAIDQINKYASQGRDAFECDELIQVWIVHHVQIIGEAAAQLSEAFRTTYHEIPWREIVAMRNIVVHAYFRVALDEVWGVVERDLPLLKAQIERVISSTE